MPAAEIATIGDQPNDVLMFKRSGFSIAMGNAPDEVKAQASADHGLLQRRRLRQGDGAVHSRFRGIADPWARHSDASRYSRTRWRWRAMWPNG